MSAQDAVTWRFISLEVVEVALAEEARALALEASYLESHAICSRFDQPFRNYSMLLEDLILPIT